MGSLSSQVNCAGGHGSNEADADTVQAEEGSKPPSAPGVAQSKSRAPYWLAGGKQAAMYGQPGSPKQGSSDVNWQAVGGVGLIILGALLIVAGVACIIATVGVCAPVEGGAVAVVVSGAGVLTASASTVTVSAGGVIAGSAIVGGSLAAAEGAGVMNSVEQNPEARSSTGRNTANTPEEQSALESAKANPSYGTQLRLKMNDPQWPSEEGWVKMERDFDGIKVHWNWNEITGDAADFKFKP